MLHLEEITNKNVWEICNLKVRKDQEDFVAKNSESIIEAFATRNEGYNALPLGVYDDDKPIGFAMIGKGTVGDPQESQFQKDNYVLWRFMIDEKYQHQGYGKKALDLIIEKVKQFPYGFSECIWTSYEPENTYGQMFYNKYGFKENGEMAEDEIMAVMKL